MKALQVERSLPRFAVARIASEWRACLLYTSPMGRCLMSLIKKLNTFFGTKIGPGHLDISLWLFAGLQHSLISQDEAAWTTMTY